MKAKIALLLSVVGLIGCSGQVPATIDPNRPTPTKMPTVLPTITESTSAPTEPLIPSKTPLPLPEAFDPAHPFRLLREDGQYVELMNGTYTEIHIDIDADNNWSWVTPELSDGSDLTEQLSHCMRKMIMTNGYDLDALVGWKLEAFIHSGIAKCGQENSANFIREFLEGPFRLFIDFENRPAREKELIGKTVTFKQSTIEVKMNIVDIVMVKSADWFAICEPVKGDADAYEDCTSKANGTLDRFFVDTGVQPGVREMFVVFCSAEKDDRIVDGDAQNKYILRLQP